MIMHLGRKMARQDKRFELKAALRPVKKKTKHKVKQTIKRKRVEKEARQTNKQIKSNHPNKLTQVEIKTPGRRPANLDEEKN